MSHANESGGASHGSVKTYMTGFILSILQTVNTLLVVYSCFSYPAVIRGTIMANAV
ncbi:cytochrome o ubiquinol oxidase subunit IV, partial [Citrobacter freundii]